MELEDHSPVPSQGNPFKYSDGRSSNTNPHKCMCATGTYVWKLNSFSRDTSVDGFCFFFAYWVVCCSTPHSWISSHRKSGICWSWRTKNANKRCRWYLHYSVQIKHGFTPAQTYGVTRFEVLSWNGCARDDRVSDRSYWFSCASEGALASRFTCPRLHWVWKNSSAQCSISIALTDTPRVILQNCDASTTERALYLGRTEAKHTHTSSRQERRFRQVNYVEFVFGHTVGHFIWLDHMVCGQHICTAGPCCCSSNKSKSVVCALSSWARRSGAVTLMQTNLFISITKWEVCPIKMCSPIDSEGVCMYSSNVASSSYVREAYVESLLASIFHKPSPPFSSWPGVFGVRLVRCPMCCAVKGAWLVSDVVSVCCWALFRAASAKRKREPPFGSCGCCCCCCCRSCLLFLSVDGLINNRFTSFAHVSIDANVIKACCFASSLAPKPVQSWAASAVLRNAFVRAMCCGTRNK